ncbi:MAG: PIN domain-containing protein [Spirochaetaceae bacterium]|nr:MAG: PIN domain-containing protein [Spirochaetaceae bacterium]
MTRGSVLFLDTNVLLAASDRSRSAHPDCTSLFSEASMAGCHLACTPLVLREYLVVSTRPIDVNGLGLSTGGALRNVREFRKKVVVLDESTQVLKGLLALVEAHGLTGKRVHDANIVAAMAVHRVDTLVTSNDSDFKDLLEGRILSPAESLSLLRENLT